MESRHLNILILSCGTRNKIVQYFEQELTGEGKVVATDCSKLSPALYEADKHYIVPRITEDIYIDTILDICKREEIDGVLSLIDPELSLLALNMGRFQEIGVTVIGSPYDVCERSFDKYEMYKWLCSHGYACAKSYLDIDDFKKDIQAGKIAFPVFVKPVKGSASISATKVYDEKMLELLMQRDKDLMIQEFLDGQEIGADCYIDMISGEAVSIFTKNKIAMRAGETDKAVSFKDSRLFDMIEKFVEAFGFRGPIDIDVFNADGEYYISEVNPRFGGGYPLAHECGCNHIGMIANNLMKKINKNFIGDYKEDVYMMKYNEVGLWRKTIE